MFLPETLTVLVVQLEVQEFTVSIKRSPIFKVNDYSKSFNTLSEYEPQLYFELGSL